MIMKKPENIIETEEYIEPHTFENDSEAVLFYSYIEQIEYIKHLESKVKNLNIDFVSCSALDDLKKQLEIEKQDKEDNRDNMFISTYQDGKVEATKKAIDILEGYCN